MAWFVDNGGMIVLSLIVLLFWNLVFDNGRKP